MQRATAAARSRFSHRDEAYRLRRVAGLPRTCAPPSLARGLARLTATGAASGPPRSPPTAPDATLDRPERRFILRGGNAEAFACKDREVLVESGAGTGKSYGLLIQAYLTASQHPNARLLFLRKSRKSLNVVLEDWETRILYPGHAALAGSTAHFTGRETPYRFPNGSEVWLGGLDNPDKWMSSKWDRIYVFEATDGVTLRDWQYLLTRLRAFNTPYHQLIADCNPRHKGHWLNRRANEPYQLPDDPELAAQLPPPRQGQTQITRVRVRHEDNPLLWDNDEMRWTKEGVEYMTTLHALKGHDRERLLHHRWISAEGLVYPEWDPDIHVVRATCEWSKDQGCWKIVGGVKPGGGRVLDRDYPIHRFIVGGDKGWTHAGALQLWGLDADGRMWLVKQAHHTRKPQSWWADLLYDWHKTYGIWRGWFEHDGEWIKKLNDRISAPVGRDGSRIIRLANKSVMIGLNEVRERLTVQGDGMPRQLILEDSLCHEPDYELASKFLPTCLQEERDNYTWKEIPDGKDYGKDEPEKEGDDSEDACRYATMGIYRKDTAAEPAPARPVSSHRVDWAEDVLGF